MHDIQNISLMRYPNKLMAFLTFALLHTKIKYKPIQSTRTNK